MKAKTIAIVALLLLVAIISIQNAAVVELKLFIWNFSISRILLILLCLIIGMILGYLLSFRKPSTKKQTPEMKK